ncbi:hypothetical protein [Thalassospira xiamenensis]|uniref:hypothetical protein n=1 Tax=Thalassospira xiamenensis TaxID=220697 RepID=UPI003AA8F86F
MVKLNIDIHRGVLEVEGSEDLVLRIYDDFKDRLLSDTGMPEKNNDHSEALETPSPSAPKKARVRKRVSKSPPSNKEASKKSNGGHDSPKINADLDLRGLEEFYSKYAPSNNNEKILLFVFYLKEIMNIAQVSSNDVFTCFKKMNQKIPKAYVQAFIDTRGQKGFVKYESLDDIELSINGQNFVQFDMKKAE